MADAPQNQDDITGIDQSRLLAAMSYLAFLVFFSLFANRGDAFVSYHARQGLIIFIGYVLGGIASIWVPIIGNLFILLLMIVSVMGVIHAVQGNRWKIPVITNIANKFTF